MSEITGKILRDYMTRRGMLQGDLADAVGISQKHLSEILNGHAGMSRGVFLDICRALDAEPAVVMAKGITEQDVSPEKREAFRLIWPGVLDLVKQLDL